jgi:hypothetical protein
MSPGSNDTSLAPTESLLGQLQREREATYLAALKEPAPTVWPLLESGDMYCLCSVLEPFERFHGIGPVAELRRAFIETHSSQARRDAFAAQAATSPDLCAPGLAIECLRDCEAGSVRYNQPGGITPTWKSRCFRLNRWPPAFRSQTRRSTICSVQASCAAFALGDSGEYDRPTLQPSSESLRKPAATGLVGLNRELTPALRRRPQRCIPTTELRACAPHAGQ